MPLSNPGSLTEQEAIDISAYISTMNRDSRWCHQDHFFEPNPCGRPAFLPLDVGVTPAGYYEEGFTDDQARFGPWSEINDWLKTGPCTATAGNELWTPLLDKDFNTGFDGVDFNNPNNVIPPRR